MAHTQVPTAREEYQYQQLDRDESLRSQESAPLGETKPASEAVENVSEVSHWGLSPKVTLALTIPYFLGM